MSHNSFSAPKGDWEHQTLNERVLRRIRELILSGTIGHGAQLDEQTLAQTVRTSRTPVREAISKLNKEGLVEYRPYKGHFVRSFNLKQVNNLFEVRKALEGLTVRLAVANLTDEAVAVLQGILDRVQVAIDQGNLAECSAADREFHNTIAHLSENETLIEMLDRIGMQIQLVRTVANRDPQLVERTAEERPQILAAMQKRDAVLASQLMELHIETVRQFVIVQIEELARGQDQNRVQP